MHMNPEFCVMKWYGKGPHQSYPDMQESAMLGTYCMNVEELHEDYIRPQENGNRSQVRWVSLESEKRNGFFVSGVDALLNAGASYYTPEELNRAGHNSNLKKGASVIFNVDYRLNGIGTGSCGPRTFEHYRLKLENGSFSVRIRPYQNVKPETFWK